MENSDSIKLDAYILKNARKAAGHTQVSLAEEVKISERTIKRIENGDNTKSSTALALCEALNVSLPHLKGEDGGGDYAPCYWCKSYLKNTEVLCEEVKVEIGNIYNDAETVTEYIGAKIDELFYQHVYSPCKYEVSTRVTLDKSTNTYILDVSSCFNSDQCTSNVDELRFEIRPFRFDNVGMKWSEYNKVENKGFEITLQRLAYSTTYFISDNCEKVEDPFYGISIETLTEYTETHNLDDFKCFDLQDLEGFDLQDFRNIADGTLDIEDIYTEYLYKKVLLFKKIESVESFLHEIIQKYQPVEIERAGGARIVLQAPQSSPELDLSLTMFRYSISQNKSIYWPWNHLSSFTKKLCVLPPNFCEKVLYLVRSEVLNIAHKHGGFESKISLTNLNLNRELFSKNLCN